MLKKKSKRLVAIREILAKMSISKHDELVEALKNQGFKCTQATLSRDLKVLKVGKIFNETGESILTLPNTNFEISVENETLSSSAKVILSIDFSMNIGVIRTIPGFAGSVASRIDSLRNSLILGTIAGDDTIMLVLREGFEKSELFAILDKKNIF